ncbi:MAG: hypothetical protein KIS76_00955 [Pyrinomonadaceae bacterium]|nr:hypothetical protein [Pyrinomonadaceae bacterium]
MDVYQKVLVKLHEASGGRDSQTVDFKELVKDLGFLGNYPDIFKQMSRQGWIAETRRPDVVCITHWGIKEAKKIGGEGTEVSESEKIVAKETERLQSDAKQFAIMLDEFAGDRSKGSFASLDNVFGKMSDAMGKIKANVE